MSFETTVRAIFDALLTAHPDWVVAVQYGTQTANGLRVQTSKETAPGLMGQAGSIASTVRVKSDEIAEPTRGAHMTVGGVQVYVLGCRTSGGLRVIECSDVQPVEGV